MSEKKKNKWTDWEGASQSRAFRRQHEKTRESFTKATEDFKTVPETFGKLGK